MSRHLAPPPTGYQPIHIPPRCNRGRDLLRDYVNAIEVFALSSAAAGPGVTVTKGGLKIQTVQQVLETVKVTWKDKLCPLTEAACAIAIFRAVERGARDAVSRRPSTPDPFRPVTAARNALRIHDGACGLCRRAGYRICARCGKILCPADSAIVVYRAPGWGIYTHPKGEGCPPRAVPGWLAVRTAIEKHESNRPIPRLSPFPLRVRGLVLPVVSLLDDAHCKSEMNTVDISQGDFLPNALPSGSGEKDDADESKLSPVERIVTPRLRDWWQKAERVLIERLGHLKPSEYVRVLNADAEVLRDVLNKERARLHRHSASIPAATIRGKVARREEVAAIRSLRKDMAGSKSPRRQERSKPGKLARVKAPGALTCDLTGAPVEQLLYSKQKIRGGWPKRLIRIEGKLVDAFDYYCLDIQNDFSHSKPQPVLLMRDGTRFNSKSNPELFDWSQELSKTKLGLRCPACRKRLELTYNHCALCGEETTPQVRAKLLREWTEREVEHEREPSIWLRNPGSLPCGDVATLKPAALAAVKATAAPTFPRA